MQIKKHQTAFLVTVRCHAVTSKYPCARLAVYVSHIRVCTAVYTAKVAKPSVRYGTWVLLWFLFCILVGCFLRQLQHMMQPCGTAILFFIQCHICKQIIATVSVKIIKPVESVE